MRRLITVGLASLLLACGGPRTPVAHAPDGPTPLAVTRTAGIRLASLRRPMGSNVWMSLTLDAGSQDADPPQVAALAAFMAVAGSPVHARIGPDTTEFAIHCPRNALRRCARQLAALLARRDVERDALAAATRELSLRRRRAAQSDARQADQLALRALLGEGASPLGLAARDDDADGDRVGRFFEAHYGANRALLMVVGDVDEDEAATAARAFRSAPTSLDERSPRTLPTHQAVARGTGRGSYVSAALTLPSLLQATAVGRALVDPLLGDPSLRVRVFPLRGANVTLVGREAPEPADDARALVASLLTHAANVETSSEEAQPPASVGDAVQEARAFAAQWSAGLTQEPGRPRVSVAVVAPHAPALDTLTRAYDEGVAQAGIDDESDDDDENDELVLDLQGAKLRGQREPGATRVAVAISFLGGALDEPPALHGRSALLAHLMAERCGLERGRLSERLSALGGRATPVIRPERVGVIFVLPRARWREAVDLAARCALRAPNGRTDIDGTRTEMLTRRGLGATLDERAARLLDPTHPGRVAPEGSGVALTRLTAGELEAGHAELVTLARLRASVVGDVPLGAALERLARWLVATPRGSAPQAIEPWPRAHTDPQADPGTRDGTPHLLLALRVPAGATDAESTVRALGRAIGRRVAGDGVTFELSSGGSSVAGSWVGVEWRLDAALLDALPARIAAALRDARLPAQPAQVADSIEGRAWQRTAAAPETTSTATVIEALLRAAPLLQIRGVGRSPTLERLAP